MLVNMLGYDTINWRVDVASLNAEALNQLGELLPKEGFNSSTGARWQSGAIENLKASLSENGLILDGSIAKFLHGDNTVTVSRREIGRALEKLSDIVHVDMSKAEVRRLDISTSLQMKHKVQAYLNVLGTLTFFSRTNVSKNTLYYQRGEQCKQALIFYDKEREIKDKHTSNIFPKPFKDTSNVLRYEARLLKQVAQQTGENRVTGAMLSDETYFHKLAKFWGDSYFSIQKTYKDIDISKIKTPAEAKDCLLAHLLTDAGAQVADKFLTDLKAVGAFSNRLYYSRLKQSLKETMKRYNDTEGESLALELDNAVRTELSYL